MQRLANEKDIGLHEAALEGLQSRTGEAEARARELHAAIEAAKAKIEANALKIAEIERTRGENKEKIAAAEETIRTANAARMEKEAAVAQLRTGKPRPDRRARADERRDGPPGRAPHCRRERAERHQQPNCGRSTS